ncbi:MAG: hypothetical protein ACI8Z1_000236 [Candidatus Azotimanducaceae bacterium]|jgi:hypothetical protein
MIVVRPQKPRVPDAVVKPAGAEKRHKFGVFITEIEVDVIRLAASSGSPSMLGANGDLD